MNIRSKVTKAIAIAIALVTFFVAGSKALDPRVVGDGTEYVAQALSISKLEGTYLTKGTTAWNEYSALHEEGRLYISARKISVLFPHICKEKAKGCDYNHFWAYSLLSTLSGGAINGLRAENVERWFSYTNFLLLLFSSIFSYRLVVKPRKKLGLDYNAIFAISSFILLSGITWWVGAVHTEIYTFSMIMLASTLLQRRKLVESSLFFAIAALQNLFWGPVAAALTTFKLAQSIKDKQHIKWKLSLTNYLLISIHPLYYYINYGLITPQQGLGISFDLKTIIASTSFVADPSNGILWYTLAIPIIIIVGTIQKINRKSLNFGKINDFLPLLLIAIFTFFACSKTINFNSGATYGPARYGLFFIALSFPFYVQGCLALTPLKSLYFAIPGVVASKILTGFLPIESTFAAENFLTRTPFDKSIPLNYQILLREPEAFIERSEGIDYNMSPFPSKGILYDDKYGNYLLVYSSLDDAESIKLQLMAKSKSQHNPKLIKINTPTLNCNANSKHIKPYGLRFSKWSQTINGTSSYYYYSLIDEKLANKIASVDGVNGFAIAKQLFHSSEDWGAWSKQNYVQIEIPNGADNIEFLIKGPLLQNIKINGSYIRYEWISNENNTSHQEYVGSEKELFASYAVIANKYYDIKIPKSAKYIKIFTSIVNTGVPGNPDDNRYLGIAFGRILFKCSQSSHR